VTADCIQRPLWDASLVPARLEGVSPTMVWLDFRVTNHRANELTDAISNAFSGPGGRSISPHIAE
jgi:hypothetical protein